MPLANSPRPIALLCAPLIVLSAVALHGFEQQVLRLPGPPISLLQSDLDADGLVDLVAVVAYRSWDELTFEEEMAFEGLADGSGDEDRLTETVLEVLTVVPALFDRREILVFPGTGDGTFGAALPPIDIEDGVLTLEPGPDGRLFALTDQGISRLDWPAGTPDGGPSAPTLTPVRPLTTLLSGSDVLVPSVGLFAQLNLDDRPDLLVPLSAGHLALSANDLNDTHELATDGAGVTRGTIVPLHEQTLPGPRRAVPRPLVRDLDGDRLAELLVRERDNDWRNVHVYPNRTTSNTLRFGPPEAPLADWPLLDQPAVHAMHVGDLDGDGHAEIVVQRDLSDPDAGIRRSMRQAKRPPTEMQIYRTEGLARPLPDPSATFRVLGYASPSDSEESEEVAVPGGFVDLNADGRLDLVTVTLDFSVLQAVRILATRSISIGMDFHVYCQGDHLGFEEVRGLDLSGKFRLRLDDLRLGQLSQFAGDFDGDGRRDFLQMGRGRDASIHLGRPGCRYNRQPDLSLRLSREPRNLALVRVGDWNQDGRSDLAILHPVAGARGRRSDRDDGSTTPVDLELHLSTENELEVGDR